MSNNELYRKIAFLESQIDLMETEFAEVSDLLVRCGFPQGIDTLKDAALELLADSRDDAEPYSTAL
jgi:hypothetical protein